MKILVTGGAGFIGSNFIHFLLGPKSPHPHDYQILNLDKLTYAGNLENVADLSSNRGYQFVQGDICDGQLVETLLEGGVEAIVNFAAESHVDRSLYEPDLFIKTNVGGVQVLLHAALRHKIKRFIQVSTDEVMVHSRRVSRDLAKIPTWHPTAHTRPARPQQIFWCGLIFKRMASRRSSPAVPIIMDPISFPKS